MVSSTYAAIVDQATVSSSALASGRINAKRTAAKGRVSTSATQNWGRDVEEMPGGASAATPQTPPQRGSASEQQDGIGRFVDRR